jgi:aminopeptidase N
MRSRPVKRIADVRLLRNSQFPEDAGPLAHPVRPASYIEINNFYTATVYEKGAEVIRALKVLIGADAFARGMDLYFDRHDGEAATVEDFVACMAEASGRDLAHFMAWYTQAGTPRITVTTAHDAAAGRLTLEIAQETPRTPGQDHKAPLHVPLRLGLIGRDGADMDLVAEPGGPLDGDTLELTRARQRFVFSGIAAAPAVSINRGFSAPIALSIDLSPAERLFLMAHDSDPFNRWQAGQDAAMALLVAGVGGAAPDMSDFAAALGLAAGDETLEPAFRAELLRLPGEVDMAREIGRDVDTDAVHAARKAALAAVGGALADQLAGLADRHRPAGPYSPDPASAGARALAQAARELLAAARDPDGTMAYGWFAAAGNMTEKMGALAVLKDRPGAARAKALAEFHAAHRDDANVIDKWLALQAASSLPGTLAEVRTLADHAAFTFDNPNRVRALIGTFAMANQVRFNAADGTGYDFVADAVLRLDRANPQVAARLLGAFKSWRFLDAPRRKAAESTLRRVGEHAGLSKDVYEIATKSLQ